jgi:hypothetical protein
MSDSLIIFVLQEFLSKQNPPLRVPESMVTRWHPRFQLDSVPDIVAADLPQPPEKVYQTAEQVLEAARGKLPARVSLFCSLNLEHVFGQKYCL